VVEKRLDPGVIAHLLGLQRNEITEHHIYRRLAAAMESPGNRSVLERIAGDELRHARAWSRHTGREVKPARLRAWFYYWVSRLLGVTFGIKLMERGEEDAQATYQALQGVVPGIEDVLREEEEHEAALIGMLDEERLRYMGSIVLGLNDALVELTGGLAGLTLALQNTRLIALSGLTMGIAAALSMAASEYLSTKAEKAGKLPLRSALYTGVAYVATVALLISPYLLLQNHFLCLAWTLATALLIIAAFNFYLAVARDEPFRRQFLEMAAVSLGVAAFSFGVGYGIRVLLGVEI
jgi:VIT1/CCC1 family predicted Fe2+/Mn2+ transporter